MKKTPLRLSPPNDYQRDHHADGAKLDHVGAIAEPGFKLVHSLGHPVPQLRSANHPRGAERDHVFLGIRH
ncbi:MAG TPA: hypothetical protein VGX70_02605 [Gemmataceae bacterium]|nr:hypothetical protein [Gemmataceae bacterium]